MPFGTNAPLRVMLVSRLMMRASGRTRVNSCRAAPQIGELDSSWASSVHLLGKADVILADLKGHMGGIGFDLYLSRHYVSAEKNPSGFPHYGLARKLFSGDAHERHV